MQVSWIDVNEVGALLGRLRDVAPAVPLAEEILAPAGHLLDTPESEQALEAFRVEIAAAATPAPVEVRHPDLQDFRARLQAIRERAMDAGLLPGAGGMASADEPEMDEEFSPSEEDESEVFTAEVAEAPAVVISAPWLQFQPEGQTVADRLSSFVAWAQPQLGDAELFIIGDQGDMLWGRSAHQGLVHTTVMAWVATSRMSAVFAFDRAPLLRQTMANGQQLTALPCPTRLGLMHIAIMTAQPLSDEHVPELRAALISAMEAAE